MDSDPPPPALKHVSATERKVPSGFKKMMSGLEAVLSNIANTFRRNINRPTLIKVSQRFIGGKLYVRYSITQKNTFGNDCFMLICTFFTHMLTRLLVVWSVGTKVQYTGFRG